MRKNFTLTACVLTCACFFYACQQSNQLPLATEVTQEEKGEGYDGPAERAELEFEKTKDPALGYVPTERLANAIDVTQQRKNSIGARTQSTLLWAERGPIFDSVGPSNGNGRAGVNYTAGRVRAVLVDTLNDPSGNTVFAGGVAGGLWKCTNFLSPIPNWQPIDDYFDNLALSSMAQDPTNPSVMYFSTGEATSNADAVFGRGLWKSTDAGSTWQQLSSTTNFIRNFKVITDNAGNIYVAARPTTTPVAQPFGLLRSKDGGASWTNITPTGLISNSNCTDIELSSTGRLHASFGYSTGGTTGRVNHRYTDDPANVMPASWNASTGIRSIPTPPAANRLEIATLGNILYAITTNSGNNVDSCYKSIDGGETWTKQNTAIFPAGLGSSQAWYNLTLTINPANPAEIIAGGLDAYKSVNNGLTMTRLTFWVTTAPYVHADHHFLQWWYHNGEGRVLIGCDGGLFLSRDNGITWADKNRNFAIKQFYSGAIHPDAGSPYLLGGTQDNGVHQLKYPGLGPSTEVTGGDGCYVHINQQNPNIQFGSYVFNQYRRSVNGGQTWSSVNFSSTTGFFVNPFDYDDGQNIMYASNGVSSAPNNQIRRWPNANTTTGSVLITIPGLIKSGSNTNASAFKVSPYTPNRVYIGGSTGRLLRVDNANTVTSATVAANTTDLSGAGFSNGFINCVNVGSSDQYLVAVFSNYGVTNVWYSTNGGTSWTGIDGNLPDMPVRWAIFVPGHDDQLILATEAGVYTTEQVNGSSTVWMPNPGFPTVRTDMLKMRTSDNTVLAATHGRGMFTAEIPMTTEPEVRFVTAFTTATEGDAFAQGCRPYQEYFVKVGIVNPPTGDATVTYHIEPGNTALNGVDFDFTTNGSFTSPSNQHVFTSGITAVKTITIRVYDDVEIEPEEVFTLGFAISGSTDAVAGSANTHNVTISDNGEQGPHESELVEQTIGIGNTALTQPFRGQFSDARTQVLYRASELIAAGFRAGVINSIGFNVVAKNSTAPFESFTVKMKNTLSSGTAFGTFEAGATPVFGPVSFTTAAGMNTITLATPFTWDGVSNLLLDICYDNTTGTATDNVAGSSGINLCHFDRVDNAAGCSLPAATFGFTGGARPDVTINMTTFQTPIATALNTSKTEHLDSYNDLYYFSPTGEIMARIRNLSAHDYGCTEVVIDRAGTGASRFWNNSKKNYLADKTFRVLPANPNAQGRYEITLYYTREEKEGWERVTGNDWNEIQIVKTSGAISEVTPSNAQPNNGGTVQTVANPTRGTFGTGYTITHIIENGFGGFGVGLPGRMNNVLTVQAGPKNGNTRSASAGPIEVSWKTGPELNSTYFELEKSYDGVTFHKLATIAASGNTIAEKTYRYTDNENVELNYYRVTLFHADNYKMTSNIALLRNENALQQMFVMTNPFNNEIRVRFAKVPAGQVQLSLYDMQGRLINKYQASPSGTVVFRLQSSLLVSRGIYNLEAIVDGKRFQARLMKQ